jgi:hypothetical protein
MERKRTESLCERLQTLWPALGSLADVVRVLEGGAISHLWPRGFWRAALADLPELPKLSQGTGCEGMDAFFRSHGSKNFWGIGRRRCNLVAGLFEQFFDADSRDANGPAGYELRG